jgi:hypothetical protein
MRRVPLPEASSGGSAIGSAAREVVRLGGRDANVERVGVERVRRVHVQVAEEGATERVVRGARLAHVDRVGRP